MHTISDILLDVSQHCLANNMIETCFSYRLFYFVNSENGNGKHYVDTSYDDLRIVLENIVRKNLTTTNRVVLATVTTLKGGKCVSLLSRSYGFSLDRYFQWLNGEKEHINNNSRRRKVQWC